MDVHFLTTAVLDGVDNDDDDDYADDDAMVMMMVLIMMMMLTKIGDDAEAEAHSAPIDHIHYDIKTQWHTCLYISSFA